MPKDSYGHHRISFDENKLNASYERMMDEVYLMFHTHPTMLKHIELSEADLVEYAEYTAMARNLGEQQVNDPRMLRYLPNGAQIVTQPDGSKVIRIFRDGVELRKKTVYPRDRMYHNGLPVGAVVASSHSSDAGCILGLLFVAAAWIGLLVWVLK